MTGDEKATAFVTGAAGFIGLALIKALVTRGHQVLGLTDSEGAAQRVRRAGAIPIIGDLLESGRWQDEVAADWVFHLPSRSMGEGRETRRRADAAARDRLVMDAHLLDAVAAGATRRVVYVVDASCYGPTPRRPITEDETPRRGETGGRYFLVNSDPVRLNEFAATFARLANRRLRLWRLPVAATRLVHGPLFADAMRADAVFSNIRLRGIGFRFRYPTLDHGFRQILEVLDE